MKLFAELYFALDTTNDAESRTRSLVQYLRQAAPEDAIRALHLLSGERPRRLLPLENLLQLAREMLSLPDWLVEESLTAVKDPLETLTLLLSETEELEELPLHFWLDDILPGLRHEAQQSRDEKICSSWRQMDFQERFVWNKLLSGGFRLQLPDSLIVKVLSMVSGLEAYVIAYRLKQKWDADQEAYHALITPVTDDAIASRPYAFASQQSMTKETIHHADIQRWHIEFNWPGLRVQCVKRQGEFFLWSQETEFLTDKFPEFQEFGQHLPDGTVIEAQLVGWRDDSALPPETLQPRIRRKLLTHKLLQETPLRAFAFDLLEFEGRDMRAYPFQQRRTLLSRLVNGDPISTVHLSPDVHASCWAELDRIAEEIRKQGAAGLMLTPLEKQRKNDEEPDVWWSWKAQPFTLLGALLYVQRRQGTSLEAVNEYSLGVRNGDGFVKIASAEAKLCQEEQEEIDRFVKENTLERFGPVRSVKAELVFEFSFDGIQKSPRHKAGLKLENTKIIRWDRDKSVEDVGTLADLQGFV